MDSLVRISAVLALFACVSGWAQPTPPRETRGATITHVETVELDPWTNDMRGRQLRIRKFTIQPGGVLALHNHDDRPDVSYLVQGELTEYREGGFVNRRRGDTVHGAGKGVTHWQVNEGSEAAVLIVVDLFKP